MYIFYAPLEPFVELEVLEPSGGHFQVWDAGLEVVPLHVLHHLGGDLGQNILEKRPQFPLLLDSVIVWHPDRPFHNFKASLSVAQIVRTTQKWSIDGF